MFLREAEGARVVDVDGNEYVDLLMGAGPMLLGHGHPAVVEAIREQVARMTNPMMPVERRSSSRSASAATCPTSSGCAS